MKLQMKQSIRTLKSRNEVGKGPVTPTKDQMLMGVTFSKQTSIKTFASNARGKPFHNRYSTHSIE
jgi:hypothetical protein